MFACAGCQHIKGVVLDARQHPLPTAIFSVGRPDAIAVYARHKVDAFGRFDFELSSIDETDLYVYDQTDPESTLRHLDPNELSDHMRIILPRGEPGTGEMNDDMLTVPPGANP
ncbi:MAG TPA: hypothetical protein VHQ47_04695 [Phycisphaerae bacterium]|jgi:hypothetical protein|nr:hypothetical protein [Phycisphaerae bacterium]